MVCGSTSRTPKIEYTLMGSKSPVLLLVSANFSPFPAGVMGVTSSPGIRVKEKSSNLTAKHLVGLPIYEFFKF